MSNYKMVLVPKRDCDSRKQSLYAIVDDSNNRNDNHAPAIIARSAARGIVIAPDEACELKNGNLIALYTFPNALRYLNILNGGNGVTDSHLEIHEFDLTSLL